MQSTLGLVTAGRQDIPDKLRNKFDQAFLLREVIKDINAQPIDALSIQQLKETMLLIGILSMTQLPLLPTTVALLRRYLDKPLTDEQIDLLERMHL